MKKFFAVMLLAVGIIFGSQVADVSKASAADVYAYTEGGVEYYVTGRRNASPFSQNFASFVKGVSGGKIVRHLFFVFGINNGQWVYEIQDQTNGMTRSYVVEQGYLSNSGKAQTVFDITKKNF